MAKKKEIARGMYVHSEDDYIHISTTEVADTLCGYNDVVGYEDTDKPITCPTCLRLFNWCRKVELPKS